MASSSEKRCLDEVLGLNRDCTADEIRSAYRRLALQRHPDKLVRSGVPEADDTNAFQELVNAYEVLFDTRERAWGYYKVYRDLFEKIYANELNFAKKLGLPLPKEASVMGNLESPYVQSRRLMDEENNKLRSGSLKPDLCCCAMVGEAAEEIKEDDGVSLDDSAAASSRNEQFHERKERDYTGTPYVPVFVMLPLGFINMECELIDADNLINQMRILKSINVDGVMVDCWWGIVEAHTPQQYNWSGYRKLFEIVRDLNLKLQVVMSFHEYGGNVGDDVHIRLPKWAMEIGSKNPDIFFTDKEGRRNRECLTWGIDKQRVLKGRNALEVYFDYMRSFRVEFNEFFEDGLISEIEIGLGACGDLRYPSYPANFGWEYPGIGEFQCYDKYLMESLEKAAEARGHSIWEVRSRLFLLSKRLKREALQDESISRRLIRLNDEEYDDGVLLIFTDYISVDFLSLY